MDVKELVASITRELLAQMQQSRQTPPKVLYIVCDSAAHEPYLDQLIRLGQRGICHDLLFLDGETSSWIGMHKIECGGAGRRIAADEDAPAPLELARDYDALVVPEIDLDNAARIAQGIRGTVKAELMFAVIVLGKPVFVGKDGSGIRRADRRTLQTVTLPEAYRRLYAHHLAAMAQLGIQLWPQRDLAEGVISHFRSLGRILPADGQKHDESGSGEQEAVSFSDRLLTAEWVVKNRSLLRGRGTLRLSRGTIVSPLARDHLRQMGITTEYGGEGGEG